MRVFRSSCGPCIEPAVLRRLRTLDQQFEIVFSEWALDPLYGQPLEYGDTGEPIPSPGFYLFMHEPDGGVRLVEFYTAAEGFGHREVMFLERRARANASRKQLVENLRAGAEAIAAAQKRAKANCREHWLAVFRANRKRMLALAEPGNTIYRNPKTFSYAGQRRHTSSGEGNRLVMKDARQDGWEGLGEGVKQPSFTADQVTSGISD